MAAYYALHFARRNAEAGVLAGGGLVIELPIGERIGAHRSRPAQLTWPRAAPSACGCGE